MAFSTVYVLSLVAAFAAQSHAHFLLNYPPTIGFDDDLEATAPCGSFSVNFAKDKVVDWHVGGDALAMTSIHPQATWLFRATLDQTASGNWTDLLPAVRQTGLGNYCETGVTAPASFAGSKGVIQVVQDAPDGILYQCAAVNFVSGTVAPPSVCVNVTGLSATFTSDPNLSHLPASSTPTSTSVPPISTPTAPTASVSTSSTPNAASTFDLAGMSSVVWFVMLALGTIAVRLL